MSNPNDTPAWQDYEIDTDDVCTLDGFDGVCLMTGEVHVDTGLRMSRETARALADRLDAILKAAPCGNDTLGGPVRPERPAEIIPGKGMHRVDTHIFARRIHESWCAQKGCRFKGQRAVQGVCHTNKTFAGDDYSYWEHLETLVAKHMAYLRKMLSTKTPAERIRRLESEVAAATMNQWGQLDEVVRLRRDMALLRDEMKRRRPTSATTPEKG